MQEKSDRPAGEPLRILVLQTAFLGDIILTTPLLLALKAAHPRSHLALLTTPLGKAALQGLPGLDEIISYDKNGAERGIVSFFRKVRELRGKKFEVAVSAHRSMRSALLLLFAGVPVLVGFEDASFHWVYHLRVKRDREKHDVLRNLALLAPVAALPKGFDPCLKLPLPPGFRLEKFGIGRTGKPLVGFAPGAAWPTKRWPAEKFGELAGMLSSEPGATVVLLGDKNDAGVCAEVIKSSPVQLTNLAGRTTVQELFGVVSNLDLLVCNDSAPAHIASAFNVPAIVIFGPTTPRFGFGPWKNPHRILEKEMECRPCHHHGPVKCPEKHFRCMTEVGAGEAAKAARELLRAKRGG